MFRLVLVAVLLGGAVALADEKKTDEKKTDEKKDKVNKGNKGNVALPADLKEILKLTNQARAKEKLPALTVDPILCKVAKEYSELMAKKGKMEHRLDGQGTGDRVEAAGYDYQFAAENLASATGKKDDPAPTPAELHKNWMDSPGHRKNLLSHKVTQIGLGKARDKKGDYYYTQVFAAPR
jgi:uncharacterized protein YkwD